jgi:hypothetical protein
VSQVCARKKKSEAIRAASWFDLKGGRMQVKDLKKLLGKEATKHGPWITNGHVAIHEDEIVGGKGLSPEQMRDLFGMRVSVLDTPSGEKFTSFLEQSGTEWKKTAWLLSCSVVAKKAKEDAYVRLFIPAEPTEGGQVIRINEPYVQAFGIQTIVSKGATSPCAVSGKKILVMPITGALGPKDKVDFETLRALLAQTPEDDD